MKHETEHTKTEELGNGQVAIHIFCCGIHEYRHTLHPDVEDIDASVQAAHLRAADEHEKFERLKKRLHELKGTTVQHEG